MLAIKMVMKCLKYEISQNGVVWGECGMNVEQSNKGGNEMFESNS